jgi:ABC-type multidrug transport system fused ATPase/permease subunit
LLAMVNSACDSGSEIYLAKGGRTLGYDLRVAMYSHLQRLSLAFHNQKRTGDVLTRVTGDVTVIEDFVTDSASDIVGSVFVLVGTMTYLLFNSWQVAMMAAVIVPLLSGVSNYFSRRIKSAAKEQRAREGDLASAAQEMLASIRVIQTYGRGGFEQQRFSAQSEKAMSAALRSAGHEAWFGWTVTVLEAICISAVVWLGVYLIDRNSFTPGELITFILLIQDMFKPTRRIIKEWGTIGKIFASVERISDLLDRKPSVFDFPGAVPAPRLQGRVELRRVSFAYQEVGAEVTSGPIRLALDDVSFRVDPGQVIALVGPSGAGKSTVVQLVPRLYDPHSGAVMIDGQDIREFTLDSLRAQIGMVLQDTILFTGTVAYNIGYGRAEATLEEIMWAAKEANAHEFIVKMPHGYDTELSERAANLSGGQRQRLAIARALIRNSPILLLDEPTTGLDAESTDLVLQALNRLMKGKTTIMISHDLNLVRAADNILVLKGGRIEQSGTHDELMRRGGLYASLHARQFGVVEAPVADGRGEEEEAEAVASEMFQTMLLEALPMPAGRREFENSRIGPRPPSVGAHEPRGDGRVE